MEHVLWVEKYRPKKVEDCILPDAIKSTFQEYVNRKEIPNLLLSGSAGVGKTTTALCIARQILGEYVRDYTLELNASDERGIDIIRNQINSFVNSKSLFGDGMKFVILDEVDYMTKTAQIALRYLLNNYNNNFNVRFCLICNYISRIDESLQTEFVRMRFNQLPENDILKFYDIF